MPSGPQSHFWPEIVVVEPARVDRDRLDGLGAVDEDRETGLRPELVHRQQLARSSRGRARARGAWVRGVTEATMRSGSGGAIEDAPRRRRGR